jgi:hypothetical protein
MVVGVDRIQFLSSPLLAPANLSNTAPYCAAVATSRKLVILATTPNNKVCSALDPEKEKKLGSCERDVRLSNFLQTQQMEDRGESVNQSA